MLMPRKVAHRKHHRGRLRGNAKGGTEVTFGDFGLQALEPGWITARQIEAARIAMTRHIKRGGKVWINVFPDKQLPRSRPKPAWVRARAILSAGSLLCVQVVSCSSSRSAMKKSLVRRSIVPSKSCRSSASSLSARRASNGEGKKAQRDVVWRSLDSPR